MVRSQLKKQAKREERSEDLSGRLVTVVDPTGPASEAYRTVRTSLLYSLVDQPPKSIVLTSPGPSEGKSTACANLGVVMAQADKSTLLLDCDLRRPTMHRIFGLHNLRGLTDVLSGECDLTEAWREPLPGLKVLTSGPLPPNPAELLSSSRFADLVWRARESFDYVLLDSPPTEMVSDPMILANHGDGVLIVLDAQKTRKNSLRKAMRALHGVGANVLGTIMNNVDPSSGAYHRYGYTY